MEYRESIFGFFSFVLLLLSAILTIQAYPFKQTVGIFTIGFIFIMGYIMYIMLEFIKMDDIYKIQKNEGQLEILNIKINGLQIEYNIVNKEVHVEYDKFIDMIDIKCKYEGKIRSGFLHNIVYYTNGLQTHMPDRNTFLMDYGFSKNFILTILKGIDTGVLHKGGLFDVSLILKSGKNNELLGKAIDPLLGNIDIFQYCSLQNDFIIDYIEFRMYEDPYFKPNYRRHEVDKITIKIKKGDMKSL